MRTRKPFDSKGFIAAGGIEESYGDFAKEYTPSASILMSDRWNTGIGELGVLGSFSYSQIKSRADKLMISNFAKRGLNPSGNLDAMLANGNVPSGDSLVYMPRGAVAGSQDFNRIRTGISAAVQWRSPDEKWEAIAQFIKSDARETWGEHTTEIATDNVAGQGDSQRIPNTTLAFDSGGLFTSGYITGASTGWRSDQNTAGNRRTPNNALQSNNIMRGVDQQYVTKDSSVNLKWNATDALQFEVDYQHVESTVDNLDVTLWTSSYQDVFIGLNGTKMPYVMFQPPINCINNCTPSAPPTAGAPYTSNYSAYFGAGHQTYMDPWNSFYRSSMDHIEESDGDQDALRLDGTFAFADNNWVKSIKTGVRYAKRDQTARFSTYNWGVLSEQWGGDGAGGPVWLDDPINGNGARPLAIYETYNFGNFMKGAAPSPLGPQGRLYYAGNPAKDYNTFVYNSNLIQQTWQNYNATTGRNQGWNSLYGRANVIPGTPFLQGEINPVEEKNNAFYVMTNLAHHFANGWKLSGNAGIRYTKTDRVAPGGLQFSYPGSTSFQTDAACATANLPLPAFCVLTLADRQAVRNYFNGAFFPSVEKVSYSHVLPSLNFKLDIDNGWQFRAGYFKGVAAPDFGFTRNFYNAAPQYTVLLNSTGQQVSATAQVAVNSGNPQIKPVEADNFDMTVEWYFSQVGQLTVAAFYKKLEGVVTNNTIRLTAPADASLNPSVQRLPTNNGATFPVVWTSPGNSSETGKIKGVEIGYQQTYDFLPGFFSGFGLSANYTYVDSEGVKQTTLSNTDPDVAAGRTTTIDTSKLPLQGLSKNSYNITPFYAHGPIEIRFAYNWRSKFLLTPRDVIVPFQPIINEEFGSLDASAIYTFSHNLKLALQVANLNNATTKTMAVINDDLKEAPRGFYVNDRRYTLGLRWTFE